MRACKCDRCGEYYDEYKKDINDLPERLINPDEIRRGDFVNSIIFEGYAVNTGIRCVSGRIDLCPDCMEKLISFLDGADINNLTPCITVNIDEEKVGEAMKILKEGINLDWKPCCTSGEDDMQEHGCADS